MRQAFSITGVALEDRHKCQKQKAKNENLFDHNFQNSNFTKLNERKIMLSFEYNTTPNHGIVIFFVNHNVRN